VLGTLPRWFDTVADAFSSVRTARSACGTEESDPEGDIVDAASFGKLSGSVSGIVVICVPTTCWMIIELAPPFAQGKMLPHRTSHTVQLSAPFVLARSMYSVLRCRSLDRP
jgi:hypothetical protein